MREISERLGVSHQRVHQIVADSLLGEHEVVAVHGLLAGARQQLAHLGRSSGP